MVNLLHVYVALIAFQLSFLSHFVCLLSKFFLQYYLAFPTFRIYERTWLFQKRVVRPHLNIFCLFINIFYYIYSPKKETQHVNKYNLLQILNLILNTEISITLY